MILKDIKRRIKPWMLPIAMAGGVFFHDFIESIAFLSPYLIFTMLLITFCKVSWRDFQITGLSWSLLAMQIIGSLAVYFALLPAGDVVAQATFMCVFCPTATAAPVVAGMLGGSVTRLAAFSILSNISVALLAPVLFPMMWDGAQIGAAESILAICGKVMPMILLPLALAFLLMKFAPKAHKVIVRHQSASFYIWSVALFIVVGRAVTFVMKEPADKIPEMVLIALCSGAVCCLQFYLGRKAGAKYGDKIVGGQGLGQKNTILAVWMSLAYLYPLSSIGPAAYVFWQNTINSWQLYCKTRAEKL